MDLIVWQKAMTLVVSIYKLTESLPTDERFGLISQMRRAAVSIPSNIAEGYGRRSKGEYGHFVGIALGSLRELQTQLLLCQMLDLLTDVESAVAVCDEIGAMLYVLERKLSA